MRGFTRFFCGLLLAGCAWSQQWPQGPSFFPGDLIGLQTCVTEYNYVNGILITSGPAIGITVTNHQPTVTPTSGYHIHEGTIGNPPRPTGGWLQEPSKGDVANTTGTDGCAIAKYLTADYAGTITFTATTPGGATTGVKDDLKYYTSSVVSGGVFQPYPDNQAINQPQGLYHDPGHTDLTRYLKPGVIDQVEAASQSYLTTTQTLQGSIIDRLDIYRGSLPWGGIADNTVYGADLWTVNLFEEHDQGAEVDIINPDTKQQGLYALASQAMRFGMCVVGSYQPSSGGHLSDPVAYWSTQNPVHFVCESKARIPPTAGHGNGSGPNHGR